MATTEDFTISLDQGAAKYVRRRMEEGGFASATDYFENLIVADILEPVSEQDVEQWQTTEAARRLAAIKADPSTGLSHEAFWAQLEAEGIFDEGE